jgi:hypothetical protein
LRFFLGALTCHIELFTQVHYRESLDPDPELSELYRDVFKLHWREEAQHAILDELEWMREDARLGAAERDRAVDDLIALVGAVDGLVQAQARADAAYFARTSPRVVGEEALAQLRLALHAAYRWQYILSGVAHPRFQELLFGMITPAQKQRVLVAVASIAG